MKPDLFLRIPEDAVRWYVPQNDNEAQLLQLINELLNIKANTYELEDRLASAEAELDDALDKISELEAGTQNEQ